MSADSTYQGTGLQRRRDGTTALPSGGSFDVESGATLKIAGTDKTAALAAAVAAPLGGAAAGYRVARGEAALDGSNPTSVAHGLTTVVSVAIVLKGSAAPGVGTCLVTAVINGANIDFYAWKPTGAGDCTLIASTGTGSFYWVAIGT